MQGAHESIIPTPLVVFLGFALGVEAMCFWEMPEVQHIVVNPNAMTFDYKEKTECMCGITVKPDSFIAVNEFGFIYFVCRECFWRDLWRWQMIYLNERLKNLCGMPPDRFYGGLELVRERRKELASNTNL